MKLRHIPFLASLVSVSAALFAGMLLCVLTSGCLEKNAQPFEPTEPFDINVTLSTNVITVGDTIDAMIEVYHLPDGYATIPELDHRPEVVVRSRNSSSEAYSDELAVTRIEYTLTSYRVGIHPLSTGTVSCAINGQDTLHKAFPAINLVVNSVLTNANESMRDIRGMHSPGSPFPWMVTAIIGVTLLAIILAVVIAVLVKKPTGPPPAPPPPPPHKTALEALQQLKSSGVIEEQQFEPFYVGVSGILRSYIEARFSLDAPDMTTEEFIQEATQSQALHADHQQLVADFLQECDMVKFAKMEPDQHAMLQVWDSAVRFVNETTSGAGASRSPLTSQEGAA